MQFAANVSFCFFERAPEVSAGDSPWRDDRLGDFAVVVGRPINLFALGRGCCYIGAYVVGWQSLTNRFPILMNRRPLQEISPVSTQTVPYIMSDSRSTPQPTAANGCAGGVCVEELILRARDGSDSALGAIAELCRPYLMLVATRDIAPDLRAKTSASDLVQDTFVEVQRDFENFRGQTGEEFYAWVSGILANRVLNNVRRFRHTAKRSVNREALHHAETDILKSLCEPVETPSAAFVASDEQRRVQLALANIPEEMQLVLRLRTWERKEFSVIGAELGRSAEAARKLWGRAIERLEKELRKIQ